MNGTDNKGWVCVTGATGFIAGYVVEDMLKHGYNVKGTVRSVKDKSKIQHLLDLQKKYPDSKLELVEADLMKEGSFDSAVEGCWGVLHTASPVSFAATDPQKELVDPAVNGTLNVLRSATAAGVRKVVITSSVATIDSRTPKNGKSITEEDHNTHCNLTYGSYSYSKVQAEKAAIKYLEDLGDVDTKFSMATIHPTFVIGPQQATFVSTSNQVIQVMIAGEYPMCPPIYMDTVDVRDVATAHRIALESPKATGRYITSNGRGWMMDAARILKKKYPDYPIPTMQMPVALLRLISYFDRRVDDYMLQEGTKEGYPIDGSKIERELDFKYQYNFETTMLDAAQSFIDLGIVKKSGGEFFSLKTILAIITLVLAILVYYTIRS
jgi:dihydroflavonol-4-reductase